MDSLIIFALYAIIILIYIAISLFIVYHISKYATVSEFKTIILSFFIIVATGLLISNLVLFFSVDWKILISNFFI